MRPLADPENKELLRILQQLLDENVDISAREIVRRHSSLKHATGITRNPTRTGLVEEWQKLQERVRAAAAAAGPAPAKTLREQLDQHKARIKILEGQVRALVASHAACVRAVYERGGARGLQRFWADYDQIGQTIRALGALPDGAQVLPFPEGEGT